MNKLEYAESMAMVESVSQKTISEQDHSIWFEILKDIDAASFRAACVVFASQDDPWPMPGKLRKLATEQQQGVAEAFGEAFAKVKHAATKIWHECCAERVTEARTYLNDAEFALVEALGGFSSLNCMETAKLETLRAQARDIWNSNQFQTRRLLNIPENARPKHFIETLDRSAVEQVAAKLRLEAE